MGSFVGLNLSSLLTEWTATNQPDPSSGLSVAPRLATEVAKTLPFGRGNSGSNGAQDSLGKAVSSSGTFFRSSTLPLLRSILFA